MAVTSVTINIDNTQVVRVRDSLCGFWSYQDTINGSPNPETKLAFIKRMLIAEILDHVAVYESKSAAETARQAAITDALSLPVS